MKDEYNIQKIKDHEGIDPAKTCSYHDIFLGTNFNWNKFATKLFILIIQRILLQEDDKLRHIDANS